MGEDKLEEIQKLERIEEEKTQSWILNNQKDWESKRVKERAVDMRKDLDKTGRQGRPKAKTPRDSEEHRTGRAKKKLKYMRMEDDWGEKILEEDQDPSRSGIREGLEDHQEEGKQARMIDLESISPNNPEQGTLLATQTPLRNVVEDLVAGVREENNLQHSLTTYGCLQEVPDYQEPTVVLNTPVNTKEKIEPPTIGENPRQSTVGSTTMVEENEGLEIVTNTPGTVSGTQESLEPADIKEQPEPSSEKSANKMKLEMGMTTFRGGMVKEQNLIPPEEVPDPPDIPRRQENHRGSPENDKTSSNTSHPSIVQEPPPLTWNEHSLTQKNRFTPSKKPTPKKKLLLKKIEDKKKKTSQDIRNFWRGKEDKNNIEKTTTTSPPISSEERNNQKQKPESGSNQSGKYLTTSSVENVKTILRKKSVNNENDCVFNTERMCTTHDCATKKVQVRVEKWKWIESKKCYGFVKEKVTKIHCIGKKLVPRAPEKVPTVHSYSGGLGERTQGAGGRLATLVGAVQDKIRGEGESLDPDK